MAKKKKVKKNISVRKFSFKLPEKTKRYLFASLSFLLAIIFVFSFSGNAGSVGETLKKFFDFLIGNVIYILPVIFRRQPHQAVYQHRWLPPAGLPSH